MVGGMVEGGIDKGHGCGLCRGAWIVMRYTIKLKM